MPLMPMLAMELGTELAMELAMEHTDTTVEAQSVTSEMPLVTLSPPWERTRTTMELLTNWTATVMERLIRPMVMAMELDMDMGLAMELDMEPVMELDMAMATKFL